MIRCIDIENMRLVQSSVLCELWALLEEDGVYRKSKKILALCKFCDSTVTSQGHVRAGYK